MWPTAGSHFNVTHTSWMFSLIKGNSISSSSQPVLPKYKNEEILNPGMFQIMVAFNDITVRVLSSALGFLHVIAFGREELDSFRPHVAGKGSVQGLVVSFCIISTDQLCWFWI